MHMAAQPAALRCVLRSSVTVTNPAAGALQRRAAATMVEGASEGRGVAKKPEAPASAMVNAAQLMWAPAPTSTASCGAAAGTRKTSPATSFHLRRLATCKIRRHPGLSGRGGGMHGQI